MATQAQQLVDAVAGLLLDTGAARRWPEPELLGYLNEAQQIIPILKVDAYVQTSNFQLVSGALQLLPPEGVSLSDIVCNMGADGFTPGHVITEADKKLLDSGFPGWRTEKPKSEVVHWLFDDRNPKRFYVYPPQPDVGMGYVEATYSATPADVALADNVHLGDEFNTPTKNYMLYRALSKNTDTEDTLKAQTYLNAFTSFLGSKEQGEMAIESFLAKKERVS